MNHLEIGALGEQIAKNYLKNKGYKYIESNYSKKYGEIDLIFTKSKIYYFVEVKTMAGNFDRDRLIEKIHKNKRLRLKRAIHVYMNEKMLDEDQAWRISAALVAIDLDHKEADVEFIENLF